MGERKDYADILGQGKLSLIIPLISSPFVVYGLTSLILQHVKYSNASTGSLILISRNCCILRNLISSLPVPSLDTWKKHDNRKLRLKINTGGIIFGYTCQLTPKRLTHLKTY